MFQLNSMSDNKVNNYWVVDNKLITINEQPKTKSDHSSAKSEKESK